MSLTKRQELLYTDTVTIVAPSKVVGTTSEGFRKAQSYAISASGVAAKFFRRGETSQLISVGRFPKDNDYQLDRFHMDVSVNVNDGWYIVINTLTHPYYQFAFAVDGIPTRRQSTNIRRPNYVMVYVKHVIPPFGMSFNGSGVLTVS